MILEIKGLSCNHFLTFVLEVCPLQFKEKHLVKTSSMIQDLPGSKRISSSNQFI